MKLFLISCFSAVALLAALTCAEQARFDNYRVYKVKIENVDQQKIVQQLDGSGGYDIWKAPTVGREAEIMVPPHKFGDFTELMQLKGISIRISINDVQTLIDNERPKIKPRVMDWTDYHTLEEIYGWIDEMIAEHPELTKTVIGQSHEGRDLLALHLNHNENNPTIFMETHIHAREWITSASVTYLINELLTSNDPEIMNLAQTIHWVIVPVFNVDGFVYSHQYNRLWRKTRSLHAATVCYGTDANRNFDYNWLQGGSSTNPCSDTFAGPNVFSEVETQVLRDYVTGIASQISIYLAIHSYGQWVLLPYGDTDDVSWNHDNLMAVGNAARDGFAATEGTEYVVGPTHTVLYTTTGTSADWAFEALNITISYTWEFRDEGEYGFVLPANQIIPNANEFINALIYAVREARNINELP